MEILLGGLQKKQRGQEEFSSQDTAQHEGSTGKTYQVLQCTFRWWQRATVPLSEQTGRCALRPYVYTPARQNTNQARSLIPAL